MIVRSLRIAVLFGMLGMGVLHAQTGSPFSSINIDGPNGNVTVELPIRSDDATGGSAGWTGAPTAADWKGMSTLAIPEGDSIALTGYDFQTNGTMSERIINWGRDGVQPEGILSTLVYMAAPTLHPLTPDRGTYGAVLTQGIEGEGTWLPINLGNWTRIEESRAGFPDVDYFTSGDLAGHIVIVSHTNDNSGINVLLEVDAPGSGKFFSFVIPGSARGFWPRVAIDGNNVIHVIWTYQETDESGQDDPKKRVLSYARSSDFGQSWENVVDFTGPGQQLPEASGGDSYQIDAEGGTVAIWYYTGQGVRIIQLLNHSSGTFGAWVAHEIDGIDQSHVYTNHSDPDSVYFDDSDFYGPDTVGYVTDTVATPAPIFDMMVLEDGTVIGANAQYASFLRRFLIGTPEQHEDTSAWRQRDNFITILQNHLYDRAFEFHHVRVDSNRMTMLTESAIPLPEGVDLSAEFNEPRGSRIVRARWPQFGINGDGHIFMIYGSGKEGDVVVATPRDSAEAQTFYFSHTYSVRSNDGGVSWSDPVDLTPEGVDAQYGSLADWVDDEAHIALQVDSYPGDYLTSSDTNAYNIHPAIFSTIEVMIIPTELLSGVDDQKAFAGSVSITGVSPNPVRGQMELSYTVGRTGQTSITIVDALGRTVGTLLDGNRIKGEYRISTDLSDLPSGAYHIVIANGEGTSTAPLHIVR